VHYANAPCLFAPVLKWIICLVTFSGSTTSPRLSLLSRSRRCLTSPVSAFTKYRRSFSLLSCSPSSKRKAHSLLPLLVHTLAPSAFPLHLLMTVGPVSSPCSPYWDEIVDVLPIFPLYFISYFSYFFSKRIKLIVFLLSRFYRAGNVLPFSLCLRGLRVYNFVPPPDFRRDTQMPCSD